MWALLNTLKQHQVVDDQQVYFDWAFLETHTVIKNLYKMHEKDHLEKDGN